jgi:hypothetical protein
MPFADSMLKRLRPSDEETLLDRDQPAGWLL